MWLKCSVCKRHKVIYAFGREKRSSMGVRSKCKACRKIAYTNDSKARIERVSKHYQINKEAKKQYAREYGVTYYQEHKKERAIYNTKWKRNNPDKVLASTNKRRQKQTIVLTQEENTLLNKYYKVSKMLGCSYEVDHIIPLSKDGLHHPDNLQILTKEDNLSKGAKLDYTYKHARIKL